MNDPLVKDRDECIRTYAQQYNCLEEFEKDDDKDPITIPRHFAEQMKKGKASLQDTEIAAVIAAHLAWGKRGVSTKNAEKAMVEMKWQPYQYVMKGAYRNDSSSLHRTIKWKEFAQICQNMKDYYSNHTSLESLSVAEMREKIYGRKSDPRAANKKIHLLRRWMVRNDGIVDLGLWTNIRPCDLLIPVDIYVHRAALKMGITRKKYINLTTVDEITEYLKKIFPEDPCLGDFALFAIGKEQKENAGKPGTKKQKKSDTRQI